MTVRKAESGNWVIPNSYQTPNAFVDDLLRYLTANEWKVLSIATRKILGFHDKITSRQDHISLSQFQEYRIGRETVIKVLAELVRFGVLMAIGDPDQRRGQLYEIQDNPDLIDWEAMESRLTKMVSVQAAKTSKARSEWSVGQTTEESERSVRLTSEKTTSGQLDRPVAVSQSDRERSVRLTHSNTLPNPLSNPICGGGAADGADHPDFTPPPEEASHDQKGRPDNPSEQAQTGPAGNEPGRQPGPPTGEDRRSAQSEGGGQGEGHDGPAKGRWLAPFGVIWRERFKGTLHWGMAAKALAPLVQEHGTDLVQAHFREYLKRLDDVQYANLFKFRSAFGSFSPTPKGRPGESYRDRAGPSVSHRIRRLPVDR